jgi:hypothetical protein
VEVTWIAGFDPIPEDLRFATLKLIKHWWTQDQQVSRSINRPGGLEEGMVQGPGMWGGLPPEVKELLQPYVQVGMA